MASLKKIAGEVTIGVRLPRTLELGDITKISAVVFRRNIRSLQFSRRDVSMVAILFEGDSVAFRLEELRDAVLELYDGLHTRIHMLDGEVCIGEMSQ